MTESLGRAATYIDATGATRDALGTFGRVTTAELEAVAQQRAFIGSTTQASGAAVLEYQAWINPTRVLVTPAIAVNRWQGAPAGVGVVRYEAGAAAGSILGGAQGSGESVRTGGGATAREALVIIPPGQSLGFTLTGQGQNVGQAIRASLTLEWYEQSVAD